MTKKATYRRNEGPPRPQCAHVGRNGSQCPREASHGKLKCSEHEKKGQ
jgi:hypothetical protein